ncbi:hypothetical protein HHI36_023044 [Cryptolaemus montrouzieri]|uniref:PiggyBac transposable element-derived protein domain-containing protein n=1 Tax=Cryptolaemus montrouzieri TaxID=559131 RepID=A0ABD2PFC2_9CUCU
MGRVEHLDRNVGKYRIAITLKRWYWEMMMFPINVCTNNTLQLYGLSSAGQARHAHDFSSATRYFVQMIHDKASVSLPKRTRFKTPMTIKEKLPDSLGLDDKGHYILRNETQIRCRQCHKNAKFKCSKC